MVGLTQLHGRTGGAPSATARALRAIAMIRYARWLVENGYKATAKDVVWPVIKNDLAYTAQYWWVSDSRPFQRRGIGTDTNSQTGGESGFDLWEEVSGNSFFTVAAYSSR